MKRAEVGIIGGTGLGEVLAEQAGGEAVRVETPFGPPSAAPVLANWEGVDVAFLSRHGAGHRLNPSGVPYRANIWAMKKLGVSAIIASGATGSLRKEIAPGQLAVCDQVIDRTFRRENTFFDEGVAVHVEFADPFCPRLRELLITAGQRVSSTVHPTGTYVCMEGPQFSTRAESHMHRQWGGDLIGMTCMPEAKLAREAEVCYALVALATDYDCWVARAADFSPHEAPRRPKPAAPDELLRQILANLKRGTENATALIREALKLIGGSVSSCSCHDALKLALWSDKAQITPAVRDRLGLLIGRYMPDEARGT